jgi:hypothetical protein
VFANPAILRVQTVAVSIMLGAVGKDFAGNQQQREEKLTRAYCAGLVQANISQSGCSDTATLVTTSNVSKVESSDTPFYDVFKKFCGDPKADPDLVRAQLSGAPEAKLLPTIKLPGSLSVDIWAVNWESHKYTIESEKLSANPGDNPLMIACAVRNSSATEDASVAALEKWVGIPSDKSNLALDEKLDRTNYFYHEEGSTRTAIEDGPGSSNPGLSALPNIWSFRIQDHNTHVQLLHFTGKSPSPAPAK